MIQNHPHALLPIGELNAAAYNPRVMADDEMQKLVRSLREFGFVEPVIARAEDKLLIGGHQRCAAMRRLLEEGGLSPEDIAATRVPVMLLEGISDERAKLLNVALNKIHGEWDFEKLGDLYASLDGLLEKSDLELSGFSASEIDDVLALASTDLANLPGQGGEGDDDTGGEAVAARARKFAFEVETDADAAFVGAMLAWFGMTAPKGASAAFLGLCRYAEAARSAGFTVPAPQPPGRAAKRGKGAVSARRAPAAVKGLAAAVGVARGVI